MPGRRGRASGEGSLYKRGDGRWVGQVDLGWEEGKRRRLLVYGKNQAEVRERLTAKVRERDLGMLPTSGKLSTGAFLSAWLRDVVKVTTRRSTHERWSVVVKKHLIPRIGPIRLDKLQPTDVRKLMRVGIEDGQSPSSVNLWRAVLRSALTTAVRDGLLPRNVAALAQGMHVERELVQTFDPMQARAFLAAVRGDRLQALWTVALSLGLRRGEALGLRWSDLDLEGGVLGVTQSLQRIGNKLVIEELKTRRSRRTLVLPRQSVVALQDHRQAQLKERLRTKRWQDHGLVFVDERGGPLQPGSVSEGFQRVLKRAGLPPMRFYDLRHSCATLMLVQGVSPRVVMELLGHSTITLTMDTYSHVLFSLKEEAAQAMNRVLSGSGN